MAVGGGTALGHPRGRLCSPETHALGFSGFFPLMRKEVQLAAQNEGTEWSLLSTLAEWGGAGLRGACEAMADNNLRCIPHKGP